MYYESLQSKLNSKKCNLTTSLQGRVPGKSLRH